MVGNIFHPSGVYRNGRCLCKESRTAGLHRGKQVRYQSRPREIPQQRDTEQREADRDVVNQDHDRKEDGDVSLKPREIIEDGAEHERDDEVFQNPVRDAATDDPCHTCDQVFTSLSVEKLDIDARQPVDLKQDEEIRMSDNQHVECCLRRMDARQVVREVVEYKPANEFHEHRLRPRAHQTERVANSREQLP